MIAAVDIETSCGVEACQGFGKSTLCDHALHHKLNKIDIIGVYDGKDYFAFQRVEQFDEWLLSKSDAHIIGHNFKFDYKTLKEKGSNILPRQILGDSLLLGSCVTQKVSPKYLKWYSEEREKLNEKLREQYKQELKIYKEDVKNGIERRPPTCQSHRPGSLYSLKVMAPYYCRDIQPFWENTATHNDNDYNKKDCIATYKLYSKLVDLARHDGVLEYYERYLVPWQKLLAESELEGVLIDEVLLHGMYREASQRLEAKENEIQEELKPIFEKFRGNKIEEWRRVYQEKCQTYVNTRLKDKSKIRAVEQRYLQSFNEKLTKIPGKFNLNSNDQMIYILNQLGIDTKVEKKDKELDEYVEKEAANKLVLKKAKVKDKNKFAEQFLELASIRTEVSYLKQYIESCVNGRIYCTFTLTRTRTGRLASSKPNLQNVKGILRKPFIIADADKYCIYTVDSGQVEPRTIAYYTEDKNLVKLFQENRDFHNYATKLFFKTETKDIEESDIKSACKELRSTAKVGDLLALYGGKAYPFQALLLLQQEKYLDVKDCSKLVHTFRAGMKNVFKWKENYEHQYKQGVIHRDAFGAIVSANPSKVEMTLFNTLIQGTASKMIFHASLLAYRFFCKNKIDAKPLLWVHDEVIWRFPKEKAQECKKVVDHYMTSYKLKTKHGSVPLDFEGNLSDRWKK